MREAHVYSEIVPRSMPVAEMLAKEPKGIIFSGGPASVYVEGAPSIDPAIYDAGVPVFGICYGAQLVAQQLGGEVRETGDGEYGRTALHVTDRYRLDHRELDPHAFDEWGEPYLSSYAALCKVMGATLTDLQVIWARAPGVVRVRTWFVGRMGTEWVVGLRTESTET